MDINSFVNEQVLHSIYASKIKHLYFATAVTFAKVLA